MKFKLFFILILVLCLALCGCKQEPLEATVPTDVATEPPTEPPAPKAGLLLRNSCADEQDGILVQQAMEALGYEVLVRDGKNDQAKQNKQAAALVEAGCEILVLQPVMVTGLDVLLQEFAEVPVIVLDAQPELGEEFQNVTVLCTREENEGMVAASLPAALPNVGDLNGDGTVSLILVQGPEDDPEAAGIAAEFTALLNPETHIVLDTVSAQWNESSSKNSCAQLLAKHGPDIEVIVTFDEEMALGAIAAVENGGWVPGQDFYLITIGNSTTIRNELQIGRLSGLAAPDREARLQLLQQLITALTTGEPTERVNYIDYISITP